ncbi:oxidoreductase [Amycolatopsis sp. YIM 10]|uniref:WD40/YVTN/BNR-like repeat-containing protein n=1 Tax=Amycolatopsis sp. YIM 10 TaxID=2653857 RepID=UPI0012904510|nr:oxidoreductase [Amycolatopsis sp. YIM 10]QFU90625.1 Ycf48-like protein [Amycolatopsis sp. YIM 10]
MRRTRLAVLAALLLSTVSAPAAVADRPPGWQLTPTGVTAQLRGLAAVSAKVAWASGSKGTVLRTTDGGGSWQQVAPPDATALDFRDIEAFDERRAVVMSAGTGAAAKIYRTDDGGASWRLSFENPDERAFYDCISFFDHRRGLAMSDPVDGRFRILSTEDGGRNWAEVPPGGLPPALPSEAGFAASGQCLTTEGPADAWFGTGGDASARVFHSRDGGRTWTVSETPLLSSPSAGVFALGFRDRLRGVAIGGDYARPAEPVPALALTRDGGRSWEKPAAPPVGYRSGVAWRHHTLLAVGPTGSDFSTDGGRHWTSFDTGSFDTVDCTARGACWASGAGGRAAKLG